MVVGLLIGILCLFWDFFYWGKWAVSLLALTLRKKNQRKRFDLYDFEDQNRPEKWGVLIPEEEKKLEYPFPEEHLQNAEDEIFIYGVNSKSEALLVRITRACNDESEAWVYLKLSDGRWYQLEQTTGFQRNFGGKCTSFTCGGLQMQCMAAMRRWRIAYCGMLRERKNDDTTENKLVFVKFTFMWTASSEIYDASSDLSVQATADAMAKSKWKSLFPPLQKVAESLNFYSQSGVVTGIVSIEDELDKEMYMFGERIRYVGKSSNLVGCKFKHVLGVVPESGLVLHFGKASLPNTFHNLYFGFIVHPNGFVYVIEDGHIISDSSGNNAQGKNLTVMFKAGKYQYELRGNLIDDEMHFTNKKGWDGQMELVGTEFEIDGLKGNGFVIAGEVTGVPQKKIQKRNLSLPFSGRPLTVYLTDEESHFTELTGGKGSSLGKLMKISNDMKYDFVVPKGIVVTTVAYEQFLTSEVRDKVENLKNIVYGNTKGNVHEACKTVASAIEGAYLPDNITKEIEEKLNRLFDGDINRYKVAVRSSATGEDTDQLSAAGQMDTFLGVQGLKEILTAVKKCWASQFGYIAVEYKRQNGQILNSPMAVVVQEMVECEAAGVLFTCDPVTNNPTVVVISGNYGLGESVVSGTEEPDTVVLEKSSKDEVKVKSVIVGLKEHRIVMTSSTASEEDNTVTEVVPEEDKNRCCISEEMAVKLGNLSLKIENYFKSPRDIEWGIKSNCIFILQSRPITSHGDISDYEIKHEFDGPLRCEIEYFTRANVGEVMPGAASTLGVDLINKLFCMAFSTKGMKLKQRNTFQQSKYFAIGCVPFYNQIHMTIADVLTRTDDCDTVGFQSMMLGIFGRMVEDPQLSLLFKYRKYDPLKKGVEYYLTFLKELFFSGRGLKKLQKQVFNYKIPAERGKTSKEIFDLLIPSCNRHVEPTFRHIACTEMSCLWNMYMIGVLEKARGSIDNDVYNDFAKLLASFSNVESADVPSAMQKLTHSIVKDLGGDVFRAMTVEEVQDWLDKSNSLSSKQYRNFIERHGHRCVKETDVYSVPWNADPKPLISILQKMSNSCENIKDKKEENLSNIIPHLTVPLNFASRMLLKLVHPNCRRGVREREICKSMLIKTIDNTRKALRHLSKAMVAEGYLPDARLLYFLTLDEIKDLLEFRNPRIISRANLRKKIFPTIDALKFPEVSKGRPVPLNESQDNENYEYVADLTLKGIPVSQGTVKGYVRVAMSLEEASHLKPGEILITHGTDVGWSPYFPILAGVVTELGGLVSHGAVISREYGLPCVVGIYRATRQFVTGDYVLLDGNKGIIQRLSAPEN